MKWILFAFLVFAAVYLRLSVFRGYRYASLNDGDTF